MIVVNSAKSGLAQLTRRFLADESGATAIEYALIAAGIGATIAATVWQFGTHLRDGVYAKVNNAL
jgi:pilus assembly protein Flp/PilA